MQDETEQHASPLSISNPTTSYAGSATRTATRCARGCHGARPACPRSWTSTLRKWAVTAPSTGAHCCGLCIQGHLSGGGTASPPSWRLPLPEPYSLNRICSVLVANNGLAAVKFMRSIRSWATQSLGTNKAISLVALATPNDIRINAGRWNRG